MNWRTVWAFILGIAMTLIGCLIYSRKPQRRAIISVTARAINDDVIRNCRKVALGTDRDQADYNLNMVWNGQKWYGVLRRHDSIVLHHYLDEDSSAIVRDACKQVASDSDWPAVERQRSTSAQGTAGTAADRFELREMRNGSTVTSGVIDKQTGRVWVWTSLPGGTAFVQEDMIPAPGEKGPSQE